ncbi:MAG TPA: SAM-dependent chlorinase/fluorinase [Candidatus Limnocylindrales bacterium]|nr:SAM-dependent chlorinase/fluorinase [Candidatus Limnocylindrales bacterium]
MTERPVIGFLTDFGSDSAAAICRGVILSIARDAQIVDIDHAVRKFAIGDGAFLLWAALPWLPVGVHVGIVDPGVGTSRRPIGLRVGRGDVLIGPDNGLLMPAAERLGGIVEARLLEARDLMLDRLSSTFHGRDVFAPVAAHLALGVAFERVGPAVPPSDLTPRRMPEPVRDDASLIAEVVYVDSFGNVRLGARQADLPALPPGESVGVSLVQGGLVRPLPPMRAARTFGEVEVGAPLLYEDSNGLLAIGVNQGDAATVLGLAVGDRLRIASRRA